MNSPLQVAYDYLLEKYRSLKADQSFDFSSDFSSESYHPIWQWVDGDLNFAMSSEAQGALLLDSEIGVALYLMMFTEDTCVASQVSKALSLRSDLLPKHNLQDGKSDPNGSWRVMIHWLVDKNNRERWITDISKLRLETARFEEIPVDMIVGSDGKWIEACENHSFPRLLFVTRLVLSKSLPSEIEQWASADQLVISTVKKFPQQFGDTLQQKFASEIVEQMENIYSQEKQENHYPLPSEIKHLSRIRIKDFRNIEKLDLVLKGNEKVAAAIVHGPNGTGKSSIYEALSIGLAGTSKRYGTYLSDKNDPSTSKWTKYIGEYVRPLGKSDVEPRISLNNEELHYIDLCDREEAAERLGGLSGTLMSQEEVGDFLTIDSSELGARIVGFASYIANAIRAYASERYDQARNDQKDFFVKWGLSQKIKNPKTAQSQITMRLLSEQIPSPTHILAWLRNDDLKTISALRNIDELIDNWKDWRDDTELIAKQFVGGCSHEERIERLTNYLYFFNSLSEKTNKIIALFMDETQKWSPDLVDELRTWGEWLDTQGEKDKPSEFHVKDLLRKRKTIEESQHKITKDGMLLGARITHLENAKNFINTSGWDKEYGEVCPTCDSDLRDKKGVLNTIQKISEQTNTRIKQLRIDYSEITNELNNIGKELKDLGLRECPIKQERQGEIIRDIQWLLPEDANLRDLIGEEDRRERLCRLISIFRVLPRKVRKYTDEEVIEMSQSMATEIKNAFDKLLLASVSERGWNLVRKKLTETLSELVETHLPSTQRALWVELAMNLTPAPWQLPGRISFSLNTRRSNPTATIVLKKGERNPLAYYILNESEINILGLAWFFVQYLTSGRFRHSFIVIDNPSQKMDQITYRDHCRLWETFLRLHKVKDIPLTFLLFLENDERALDAVRATNGILHRLQWNQDTELRIDSLRLMNESFKSPNPAFLLSYG